MAILTVEQILTASDIQEQVVEVPEWGGAVKIRAFTKGQQQGIRREATLQGNSQTGKKGDVDPAQMEMLMLIRGIVEPHFEPGHVLNLREKSAGAIERILRAIILLSGMAEDSVANAEATFQEGPGA